MASIALSIPLLITPPIATAGGVTSLPTIQKTYNVEIRPDNYAYYEQQIENWQIQCYQRKQPRDHYWHCNASDGNEIKKFRTALNDPAKVFVAEHYAQSDQPHAVAQAADPAPVSAEKSQSEKATPPSTQPTKSPQAAPTRAVVLVTKPRKIQPKRVKQVAEKESIFSHPAIEPETQYILQLAAFQSHREARAFQRRYTRLDTQIIMTKGKFTLWYNVITTQPVDYVNAISMSQQLKSITGETPWIREQDALM